MTLQAYQVALADLRHWHEGDRFQKRFDEIEAHVNALSTPLQGISDAEPLPAPTSILLTRDAEGHLLNPTTGEPFTIVIHTAEGSREVTSIVFAGERDVPIKLPDPVYVDSEQSADANTLKAVSVMENEDAMRAHLASLIECNFHASVADLVEHADPEVLRKVAPEAVGLHDVSDKAVFEVVKAALASPFASVQGVGDVPTATDMEPQTIDGIPVVTDDTLLPPDVDPDQPLITLGTSEDLGAVPDDADEADEGSDVPPDPPIARAKKKRG